MSISSMRQRLREPDATDLAAVGEDDAAVGDLEHAPLDLGLRQVDVRDAARRVHAVAAEQQRSDGDPLEDVRGEWVDEGVLQRPERAAEHDDGDARNGALELERGLEAVREDDDVPELGSRDERVGRPRPPSSRRR